MRRILTAVAVFAVGCSLEKPEEARLRLEVAPSDPYARSIARDWMFSSGAPASVNDMRCLALNVMGPGIPSSSINDSSYNFATKFPQALAGDVCASYGGILSNFVPVSGGVVEVSVPTGPQRLVQVLGMNFSDNLATCPAKTYFELERELGGSAAMEALVPNLWQVGRTVVNVTGDATLDISNSYSQANATSLDIQNCHSSAATGPSSNLLQFWLKGEKLAATYSPDANITSWDNSATLNAGVNATGAGGTGVPVYRASSLGNQPSAEINYSNYQYFNVGAISSLAGTATEAYFIAAVIEPGNISSLGTVSVIESGVPYSGPDVGLRLTESSGNFTVTAVAGGATTMTKSTTTSRTTGAGNRYVVWMSKSTGSTNPTLQVGTSNETAFESSGSVSFNGGGNWRIGFSWQNNTGKFPGKIAEVVLYSREFTAAERKELFCHFAAKYGTPQPTGGCS